MSGFSKKGNEKIKQDNIALTKRNSDLLRYIEQNNIKKEKIKLELLELNPKHEELGKIKEDISLLNTKKIKLEETNEQLIINQNDLNCQIESYSNQLEQQKTFVEEQSPQFEKLKAEIDQIKVEIDDFNTKNTNLKSENITLKNEKQTLSDEIEKQESVAKILKEYGLHSKDLGELTLDSKKQFNLYSNLAIASFIAVIILMIFLGCKLTGDTPFISEIVENFENDSKYKFFSIFIIRFSISAMFIFFIVIFLNLARGFIAQFIKSRNRLTSISSTHFLIQSINNKSDGDSSDEGYYELKKQKLQEQVELLKIHIPKIMDIGNSSFDKINKSKDTIEQIKEAKDIFVK